MGQPADSTPKSESEVSVKNVDLEEGVSGKNHGKAGTQGDAPPIERFFRKWSGEDGKVSPPMVSAGEMAWSFVGAFVGICSLAALNYHVPDIRDSDGVMIIGSFGASAVLAYAVPSSPLAQPRSLVGGHVVSALVGVTVRTICEQLFGTAELSSLRWLTCGLAVALAINVMQLTKTVHPPGGATALIAVIGSDGIRRFGYWYVLLPAAAGSMLMLVVALVVNNLAPRRQYPIWWW